MIYLIDFENVHEEGFSSLGRLGEKDSVYCFFTKNVGKISMSALAGIRSGQMHFVEAESGKQSLDLALVSFLGYLIGTRPQELNYEIVSNDNGFLKAAEFWNKRGMDLHVRIRKTGSTGKRVKVEAKTAAVEEPSAKEPDEKESTAQTQPVASQSVQTGQPRQRRRSSQRSKLRQNNQTEEQKKPEISAEPEVPKKEAVPAAKKPSSEKPNGKTPEELSPAVKETVAAPEQSSTADQRQDNEAEEKKKTGKPDAMAAKSVTGELQASQDNVLMTALTKAGIEQDPASFLVTQVKKYAEEKNAKQLIYRALVKQYGQKAGTAIYNIAKKVQV